MARAVIRDSKGDGHHGHPPQEPAAAGVLGTLMAQQELWPARAGSFLHPKAQPALAHFTGQGGVGPRA